VLLDRCSKEALTIKVKKISTNATKEIKNNLDNGTY
jgi:hypothetical protein